MMPKTQPLPPSAIASAEQPLGRDPTSVMVVHGDETPIMATQRIPSLADQAIAARPDGICAIPRIPNEMGNPIMFVDPDDCDHTDCRGGLFIGVGWALLPWGVVVACVIAAVKVWGR